jgi:glycyl-tRNA synthetase beta subunit
LIKAGLRSAAARLPVGINETALAAAHEFILERARVIFSEAGNKYDVVDAVLSAQGDDPYRASAAIGALSDAVKQPGWDKLLAAYSRCARITAKADTTPPAAAVTDPSAEAQALAAAVDATAKPADAEQLIAALRGLEAPITAFFDHTMVMAEDPALRQSRLALLGRVVALADGIVDMTRLEGF